jgi:hypothetical protein
VLVGWLNGFLAKRGLSIKDFPEDLTDGILLINLYEIITNRSIGKYEQNPKFPAHKLGNLRNALEKFHQDGAKVSRALAPTHPSSIPAAQKLYIKETPNQFSDLVGA